MKYINSFNENNEDEYNAWRGRRKIGFRQGGYTEPIAIEDNSRKRYDLLNSKIKIQEENISKMKDSDESKIAEINQLKQMKKVRDKIKKDNKFESVRYLRNLNESEKSEPRWWGYQAHSVSSKYDPSKPFIVKRYVGFQEKKEERARLGSKCGCIVIGPFSAPDADEAMVTLKAYIKEFYTSNSNKDEEMMSQMSKYREENPTMDEPIIKKPKRERKFMSNPLAHKNKVNL